MKDTSDYTSIKILNTIKVSSFIKVLILSTNNDFLPKWCLLFAHLWSNLQVLSVSSSIGLLVLNQESSSIRNIFTFFHQFFTMDYLIIADQSSPITLLIISCILLYLIIGLFCPIFIMLSIHFDRPFPLLIQRIWTLFTCFHVQLAFYPIHYICLRIIWFLRQGKQYTFIGGNSDMLIEALILLIIVLNFAYAAVFTVFLTIKIKTKSILSMKDHTLNIVDLIFKTIIPAVWLFADESTNTIIYPLLIASNLTWCLLRDFVFFRSLPYYRLWILKITCRTHLIITLFALSIAVPQVVNYSKVVHELSFSLITWIILIIICRNLYSNQLRQILYNIAVNPSSKMNIYYILHYWEICKHFCSEYSIPFPRTRKSNEVYFFHNAAIRYSKSLPGSHNEETKQFDESKPFNREASSIVDQTLFSSALELLNAASHKRSNDWLLKVNLARYYTKRESLYILSDTLIDEGLKASASPSMRISLYLIKCQLLRKVRNRESLSEEEKAERAITGEELDVQKYIDICETFGTLVKDLNKQIQPQNKFWQTFQLPDSDFDLLINLAKKVHQRSNYIERRWRNFKAFAEVKYAKPLLVQGLFLVFAQNNLQLGQDLISEYQSLIFRKREDQVKDNNLTAQSLFTDSIYIAVSGAPSTIGKVLDCSINIEKCLGVKRDTIIGRPINNMMPAYYGEKHNGFLKVSYENRESNVLNKTRQIQILNRSGFITPCLIHVTLNTVSEFGLCYYGLLKPIKDDRRVVLIRENGVIANSTRNFARDMNISQERCESNLNIFSFCSDIEKVLRSFAHASKDKGRAHAMHGTIVNGDSSEKVITSNKFTKRRSMMSSGRREKFSADPQKLYENFLRGDTITFYRPKNIQKIRGMDSFSKTETADPVVYNLVLQRQVYENDPIYTLTMYLISKNDTIPAFGSLMDMNNTEGNILKVLTTKELEPLKSGEIENSSNVMSNNVNEEFNGKSPEASQSPPRDHKDALTKEKSLFYTKNKSVAGGESQSFHEDDYNAFAPQMNIISKPDDISPIRMMVRTETFEGGKDDNYYFRKNSEFDDRTQYTIKDQRKGHFLTTVISTDHPIKEKRAYYNGSGLNNTTKVSKMEGIVKPGGDLETQAIDITSKEVVKPIQSMDVEDTRDDLIRLEDHFKRMQESLVVNVLGKRATEEDGTITSRESRGIMVQKAIQQVLSSTKFSKHTTYFCIAAIFAIICSLTFMIWLNVYVSDFSKTVESRGQVVQDAYFRNAWIKVTNQETRFWTAMRGGLIFTDGDLTDEMVMRSSINTTYHQINMFNQQLRTSLESLDHTTQTLFYRKNVRVYERDSNKKLVAVGLDDTFQVAEKIVAKGFINVYSPTPVTNTDFVGPEARFIFDNSFGDQLVASEDLIKYIQTSIHETFMNTNSILLTVLCSIIAVIGVFLIGSVKFVLNINSEYSRLMNILSTLSSAEVLKTHTIISSFERIFQKEFEDSELIEAFDMSQINLKFRQQNQNAKSTEKKQRKDIFRANMRTVYLKNQILLGGLFLTLGGIIAFMGIYYNQALAKLVTMEKQQKTISAALERVNLQILISAELQGMLLDNATLTIRGVSVLQSLSNDIETLEDINNLENGFKDENGVLSAKLQDILFRMSCSDSYTPLYNQYSRDYIIAECDTVARGLGRIGLIDISLDMGAKLTQFIQNFVESNRTIETIDSLYLESFEYFFKVVDITASYLLIAYTSVKDSFSELSDHLESQRLVLAWVAVIVSASIGQITWQFVIQKLANKEIDRKQLLMVFPTRLIISNPYLKRYLVMLSKGELDKNRHFKEA